jgi:23S rRNA pseudouridine2605 synthase
MTRVRLQKFLAEAGVASRRAGESIILEGRVTVNGEVMRELGAKIDPVHDHVTVDGRPLKARRKIYVAINKPRGCLCTRSDPEKRATILDFLPAEWRTLYPVGRLDLESEGLLFLTNDGEFCLRLTHPRFGIHKKYVATVEGRVEDVQLNRLVQGVTHMRERLKAERFRVIDRNNTHTVVELELAEGKNREVRRLFEALGVAVSRLARIQIGPIKLGELRQGKWRTLTETEIKSLLPQS